ncbi:hypothetical protein H5410_050267 [Solanum commersonii]|uniref:Uncharacterized protein n=1 Tax=Solanum commersonii TaxID=4109 RepID=A0A9J5WXD3_SOLCO|nr:hypothetical protein H5410_050267 [Solanum commersonii]
MLHRINLQIFRRVIRLEKEDDEHLLHHTGIIFVIRLLADEHEKFQFSVGSRRPTGERNISEPNIHDWVRIGGYKRTIIEKTTRKQSAPSIDMPPPRY